jgi:hypothetical protein
MSDILIAGLAGLAAFMIASRSIKKNQPSNQNIMLGGGDIEIEKTLYSLVGPTKEYPFNIYIPPEELNENVNLHELFKKYGIDIIIDTNLGIDTLRDFSQSNQKKYVNTSDPIIKYTHIANLSKLFEGAKEILKEYSPSETINYDDRTKWFKRNDETLRRIFSHHYEKRLVTENPIKYSNIKFPERVLVIKKYGKILSKNDTIDFIENNLKIMLYYDGGFSFIFNTNDDDDCELLNYTTYIEESGRKQSADLPHNHKVYDQMIQLCEQLGTVDYTPLNVHYENGYVYIKDLKNKGQYRCPAPRPVEKKEGTWEDFMKKLQKQADEELKSE